ncbi:peptide chain release factor N(5)-glutamine methyltransferase [Patescibacteria group bacterium]|nr:peptide chain release factor N(5)-glutamine methyltransferase [Patescibacteria group bacterium]
MNDENRLLREKYHGVKTAEFEVDVAHLKAGEPLAYVIGWTPFLDCTIHLDSHPLIPRPETEFWTEKAIENISTYTSIYGGIGSNSSVRVLDLFAGSGAIGVAVLKHVPDSRVDFGEIDPLHFPTIQKNIRENGINADRMRIIQTDVWSGISNRYDFILANPPYISREKINRVEESVLSHEPHQALFTEDAGFALIEKTLMGVPKHLTPHGALYIEHEPEHKERLIETARNAGLSLELMKDQYGVYRYSILRAVA